MFCNLNKWRIFYFKLLRDVLLSPSCHHKSRITGLHFDSVPGAAASCDGTVRPKCTDNDGLHCAINATLRLWATLGQAMSVSDQRNRLCNRYNLTVTKQRSHLTLHCTVHTQCGCFVVLFLI